MDIFLEYIRFLVNTADRPGRGERNFVRLIHDAVLLLVISALCITLWYANRIVYRRMKLLGRFIPRLAL